MFSLLMNHLWQSTLFALAIALLMPLVRTNGAHVRYWLWWAASVKFLVPFSLFTMIGRALAGYAAPIYVSSDLTAAVGRIAAPVTLPLSTVVALVALALWALGCVAVLALWVKRAFELRTLISAEACADVHLSAPAPVVKWSDARLEPGIVGIFRPVLLLPRGIAARLTPEQLQAIVEHELCHWRRRDNLTAAVHMIVEAVFWFHPLVWWIGARLIDERERACDEAVVQAGHDPRTYADGMLDVCEHYVATGVTCAAGVSGADLKKRVTNIMRSRIMNKLNSFKKALLGAAAMAALLVPVGVGMLRGSSAMAQDEANTIPLVRIAPDYPAEARAQKLEGHVVLGFTITAEGTTKDISVVESSAAVFEAPSISALSKWRYVQSPSDRTGIHTVIRFALQREDAPFAQGVPPLVVEPEEPEESN